MAVTTNFSFTLTDFDKIPWHTEEHNNWHNIDALLARYLAISNVQGVWENATAVTVGQRYIDSADDVVDDVPAVPDSPTTADIPAGEPTMTRSKGLDNNTVYDIDAATKNRIIYPSLDPCIFEIKYPNTNINGKVITY